MVVFNGVQCTLYRYRGWRDPAVSLHPHGSRLLTIVHLNSYLMPLYPPTMTQGWKHFLDKLALARFQPSAMQGVCNMDFCPLSHWHLRQVKTCQPGQLRWNTNFQRWVFWRLIAKMLWNFSRVKLHYQKIMSEHKGLFGECWNLEELIIIDLASMYAWFLYSQYIPSVLLIEIQLNDREPLSSQD